ncbi:MAG: twin-arginine translocase subunit TatC [Neisseria sp.]|nr:twin-arginine translocase subunit TatC [Neisseria sp.]
MNDSSENPETVTVQVDAAQTAPQQTLIEHLIELRNRLMKIVLGIGLCLLVLLPFAQKIYSFVAEPLMSALPAGNSMIATDVIAPFFVPLKVTLMVAFLFSLPNTVYQIWAFVAPALYKNEKKLVFPLMLSTIILFFIGMAFAYFLVFPAVFHFMVKVAPEGVNMATDIDKYLSFVLGMFIAFGVSFEVPVVVVLLNRIGMVSRRQLKTARPYVIVGAFVIAAVITPPDILSQILLAVPLIILYEFGLLMCRPDAPEA